MKTGPPIAAKRKHFAAGLSVAYNAGLLAAKIAAAALTGSVSLLSESVHSATDVISSLLALVSVRAATVPPDHEHPYGHGKIESLAGFGESILLLEIVLYIVYEATARLVTRTPARDVSFGVMVMAASTVGSLAVGRFVAMVGKESESVALQSNGQHLLLDFWTSLGVLTALVITRLTGWFWIDAAFAYVLALVIARGAGRMAVIAAQQLIDRSIPDEEMAAVHRILNRETGILSYHRLRARHSGNLHYVDVHVVVPTDWSVVDAHAIADRIEKAINEELAPAQTVVHVDPFDPRKV
jgi:cation diffusion facilitator family transporter